MTGMPRRAERTMAALEQPVLQVTERALAVVADGLAEQLADADIITAQGGSEVGGEQVEEVSIGQVLVALWAVQVPAIVAELAAVYGVAVAAMLRYLGAALPEQTRDRLRDAFTEQARRRLEGVGQRLVTAARRVLDRARADGADIDDTKARLREEFVDRPSELGDSHARLIADTETGAAWEQGRAETLQELPEEDTPPYRRWTATLDARTRPSHHGVDGSVAPVDGQFTVGGSLMRYPRDPRGPIQETANCRCVTIYAWDRDEPPDDAGRQFLTDEEIEEHLRSREEAGNPRDVDLAAATRHVDATAVRDRPGNIGDAPLVLGRAHATRKGNAMPQALTAADLPTSGRPWSTPGDTALAFEGIETGDGRIFAAGALYWEDGPWPLQHAAELGMGHDGARLVGPILSLQRDGNRLAGTGTLYEDSEAGAEAIRLLEQGAPLGVSVDLDDVSFEIVYRGDEVEEALLASFTATAAWARVVATPTGHRVAFGECAWHLCDGRHTGSAGDALYAAGVPQDIVASAGDEDSDDGVVLFEMETGDELFRITRARVRGATLVSLPAFADARIVLDATESSKGEAGAAATTTAASDASTTADQVIRYVNAHPNGVQARDVAGALGIATSNARSYLVRGVEAGKLVKLRRGVYGPVDGPQPAEAAAGAAPERVLAAEQTERFEELVASLVGDLDLPVHDDRDREWDGPAAASRVLAWAQRDDASDSEIARRLAQAFLWRDEDADPTTVGAYSLGFADVIDDRLEIVARGVFATAGGRGVDRLEGISDEDRDRIKGRICSLYDRLADALEEIPECPFRQTEDEDATAAADAAEVVDLGTVPHYDPRADELEASAWHEIRKMDPLPAAWFTEPTAEELPPNSGGVHYADGRIWGWVAQRGVPHQGYTGQHLTIEKLGDIDTTHFLRARMPLDNGDQVKVGAFTMNTGHHRDGAECETAACQFDDTRTVAGVITVGMNSGGMWFSGAASPYLAEWDRTVLLACQPSYHMKKDRGRWSLRAVLSVPVPGHPSRLAASAVVERANTALAASAATMPEQPVEQELNEVLDIQALAVAIVDEQEARERRRAEAAKLAEELAPARADVAAQLAETIRGEGA